MGFYKGHVGVLLTENVWDFPGNCRDVPTSFKIYEDT